MRLRLLFLRGAPAMASLRGRDIVIPVQHSQLGVAVSVDALPEDENEILQILQAEQAPLRLWLDVARAYLQQGKEEQGRRVLEDGCSEGAAGKASRTALGFTHASLRAEVEQYYSHAKYDRVSLLCAMASFYTRKARLRCANSARSWSALTPCTALPGPPGARQGPSRRFLRVGECICGTSQQG